MTHAADGAMGRVWRLDTDMTSYAVKELYWAKDPAAEEAVVASQVQFCDAARAAGIVAPSNLRTTSDHYVIELPAELGGRLVRAYEWIQGRPLQPSDASAAAGWAGRTQAIIEQLAAPTSGQEVDPWSYCAPTEETWDALASRCEKAQQPWVDRLRQTIPRFVALADLVTPPDFDQLIMTHTDFQPQNVMNADGRYVLLDWDDSGPSTRPRALGGLINNWHIHGTTVDHEGIQQTLTSYRAAGGTAHITKTADFGDSICGYLNYVHGQAELSIDHAHPDNLRIDAGRRMPDLLRPPPLSVYEEAILAAAT